MNSIVKKTSALVFLVFFPVLLFSQVLTVEICREKSQNNYPLIKQMGLIGESAKFNISTVVKTFLPQFTLAGKATYQSEVTSLPISLPGVSVPKLARDQYQIALEMNQVIWDGGVTSAQRHGYVAQMRNEMEKLTVDLYALNERLNQVYFGILLLTEQVQQNKILQEELNTNFTKLQTFKSNGVANQTDLDEIEVELINVAQRNIDLNSTMLSYRQMLSELIGQEVTENTILEKPVVPAIDYSAEINRPELKMFTAQQDYMESQRDVVLAANKPRFSAFIQGGYGRPGPNMLNNAFSGYYIGGLRLAWNLSGFYTQKNNLDRIENSKKQLEVQRETFLFNNKLANKMVVNDIERLKLALKNDDKVIQLRTNIKQACDVKVNNGTATVTDLLREINAENIARQAKALHEVQLYTSIYQYKMNTNN